MCDSLRNRVLRSLLQVLSFCATGDAQRPFTMALREVMANFLKPGSPQEPFNALGTSPQVLDSITKILRGPRCGRISSRAGRVRRRAHSEVVGVLE